MKLQLVQLSDIHLTSDGQAVQGRDADDRLLTVVAAVQRAIAQSGRPVDLVVLTGDITDDASEAACRRVASAVRSLAAPVLAVPGNHDDPAIVSKIFPGTSVEFTDWRVVGIDTSRPDQIHGTVDVTHELTRLDRFDQRHTILALHHPPLSPSTHPWFQLEHGRTFLDALATRTHVHMIVTGHLHDPFELRASGGPPVFGCPSTLIPITHSGPEFTIGAGSLSGARLLTMADDGMVTSQLVLA